MSREELLKCIGALATMVVAHILGVNLIIACIIAVAITRI